MKRILVTGATGQIGSELTMLLRLKYAGENVIAAGHNRQPSTELTKTGAFISFDIRDQSALINAVKDNQIDTIFHMASLLSAVAEKMPQKAWDINMNGLLNALETARLMHCAVFFPSSIGAFGPQTPATNTPQDTIQRPNTMYGVTKVSGELLCGLLSEAICCRDPRVKIPWTDFT
jgi:nucleoside-diphosphate-sugar epimerase